MAGVSFQIKFLYEDILFVDSQAYLPRDQALKIPGLKMKQNEPKPAISRQEERSEQKKSEYDEDQMIDDNQNDNDLDDNEGEMEIEGQQEEMDMEMQDENDQDDEMEVNGSENIQYDDDDEDDMENDISSISRSLSNLANMAKYKTKRQKGELDNFMELPSKRPRKDNKRLDEATELLRKEEKQRKRKQYIKKLMQAQEKATFDKILNETGRKFKQREEKQLKEEMQKEKKIYRTLGDIPKIIITQTKVEGEMDAKIEQVIQLHKTSLFDQRTLNTPEIKMGEPCQICSQSIGKYKSRDGKHFCSVGCYKRLQSLKA